MIADAPQKAAGDIAAPTVADAHGALLASARSEVLIASPYFVPGAEARATLAGLRARDVGVSVLTNSLATTDEPLVHYGYASHRPALAEGRRRPARADAHGRSHAATSRTRRSAARAAAAARWAACTPS